MIKKTLPILCFFVLSLTLSFILSQTAQANPFRQEIVCAPDAALKANQPGLSFVLREGPPCGPGERWLRVDHNEGVTYLLPMAPPLDPEVRQNLKTYKNYHRLP